MMIRINIILPKILHLKEALRFEYEFSVRDNSKGSIYRGKFNSWQSKEWYVTVPTQCTNMGK